MEFTYPKRPPSTLQELWQADVDLLPQLQRRVIRDYTIGTAETAVAHGLGFAPLSAHPIAHSDVRVWRTKAPDAKHVFLAASAACVCDIEIIS